MKATATRWPTLDEFKSWPDHVEDYEPYLPVATLYAIRWAWSHCQTHADKWRSTYESLSLYFRHR